MKNKKCYDAYRNLAQYAEELDITFLASVWEKQSADYIESLGVPAFKITSADLTNLSLLEHIAKKGKVMVRQGGWR